MPAELGLGLLDGLGETDGLTDGDGDGLTLGDGLLMISRMAICTAARSSDVPDENPTFRAPCPAADS